MGLSATSRGNILGLVNLINLANVRNFCTFGTFAGLTIHFCYCIWPKGYGSCSGCVYVDVNMPDCTDLEPLLVPSAPSSPPSPALGQQCLLRLLRWAMGLSATLRGNIFGPINEHELGKCARSLHLRHFCWLDLFTSVTTYGPRAMVAVLVVSMRMQTCLIAPTWSHFLYHPHLRRHLRQRSGQQHLLHLLR
jgi:hypothetical protein